MGTIALAPRIAARRTEDDLPRAERDTSATTRVLRQHGGGLLAGTVLLLILIGVVFAGDISPHNPTAGMDLRNRLAPPFWEDGGSLTHPLGTDHLGRDVLSRTLHGGQVSLQVALIASSLAMVFGMGFGLISGYAGGLLDRLMCTVADVWVAFPFLVFALAVIAVVGSSRTTMIALLALAGWVYPARVTRAQTLKIRRLDFVRAAHALGASHWHIIWRHVLPNILTVNIVLWTLAIGTAVLIEGSLSFLGMGVAPPTPSWGNMLNEGRMYLQDAWWLSVIPGLALTLTVLCINAAGDTLQKLTAQRDVMF